jgi:protein involved in polysaccharide export with SLBB domain
VKSTTKQLKTAYLWRYVFILVLMLCSTAGYAQDLSKAKELCNNITDQNKAMAKHAGYDLDALCSEVSAMASPDREAVPAHEIVSRKTASSSKNMSDANSSGMASGIKAKNTLLDSSFEASEATMEPENGLTDQGLLTDDEFEEQEQEQEQEKEQPLKPFGYDLFANSPTTFAPAASIAVSEDYLLGPGDTLDILFYGKKNNTISLEINREGFVVFPDLGPIGLSGLSYGEVKKMLKARISAQMIGTQASISMGSLKTMQIFVLGEAFVPGAYTVSSLSTITHALVSAGGVTDIGSLRNIQLKRKGELVAVLDLYDLLLGGDTSKDVRVQAGDAIYIPTVGGTVSVDGQVLRPAIYEIKGGESAEDLIDLAGGLLPKALSSSSRLQRINNDGFMTVLDLNMNDSSDQSTALQGGDYLIIDEITDYKKDIVTVYGAVRHEGEFSWRDGMRVSDIIFGRGVLDHEADLDVALLVRELDDSADIEVLTFNLGNIFSDISGKDNLKLESRDMIIVFADYQDRSLVLLPFIENLKRQASIDGLAKVVTSNGKVRFPGEYPLTQGMTVRNLINLSGGLLESAYSQSAEISRLDLSNPDTAVLSIVISDLTSSSSTELMPSDRVEFRTIPEYRETRSIELEGEFVFPGIYVFGKGETLSSVIRRAGGFTDEAFVSGSVFLRESLKEREQLEIDRLIGLLNEEVAGDQMRDTNSGLEVDKGKIEAQKSAIESLTSSVATGRLVIPLEDIMANSSQDLVLKDGDRLLIPKVSQEITILGEVRRPTSYLFDSDLSPADYIKQSGGFKDRADEKGVFIVKADGAVIMPKKGLFRFSSAKNSIGPGDTIVVPLDTDEKEIRGIQLLSEVSQILYQLSLGAAAINSLNNN